MPSKTTLSPAATDLLREIRDRGKNTVVGQRGRALLKLRSKLFKFVEPDQLKITDAGREHLKSLKRKKVA